MVELQQHALASSCGRLVNGSSNASGGCWPVSAQGLGRNSGGDAKVVTGNCRRPGMVAVAR